MSIDELFFFFFFQAEDGIRDYKVTGVQTCALPICQGVPVTFGVVAATAGVSRSWLYRQAGLRQQIDQLRQAEPASASHAAEGATQSSGASLRARLNQALERNRQLADDNARLRSQLAQALGEQRQPPPQVARQRSYHASTTIGPR